MTANRLNLLAFNQPEIRTLHLTWFAFFLSFMVWFAHAPLMVVIREAMHLTEQEVKILLIVMNIPMYLALGVLTWKLSAKMHWIDENIAYVIYATLVALYISGVENHSD